MSNNNQLSSKRVRISLPEHRVREAVAATATLSISATEAVNLMASLGLSVYSSTTLAALCGTDSKSELCDASRRLDLSENAAEVEGKL